MELSIIAAFSRNRVIGNNGAIPWNLPEDRLHFKQITTGHTILMGRKTFEEIGHSLPDRFNIVLSSSATYTDNNLVTVKTLPQAFATSEIVNAVAAAELNIKDSQIFVCGGQELYNQTISIANHLYITEIQENFQGDRFFPEIPENLFSIQESSPILKSGLITYRFLHYIRNKQ